MADVVKLGIKISADSKQAQAELKGTAAAVDDVGSSAKTTSVSTKALAGALAAVAAVTATALKASIDYGDSLDKTSQKLGISTEKLSAWRLAAELGGTSADTMIRGVKGLATQMDTATRTGTGPAAEAFKRLGIEITETDGTLRDSNAVLSDVADSFAQTEDGAQKTADAVAIFGRAGLDLIPVLNTSAEGIAQVATLSRNLGLVWSEEASAAAATFNDTLTLMHSALTGFIDTAAKYWLPVLNQWGAGVRELVYLLAGEDHAQSKAAASAEVQTTALVKQTEAFKAYNVELKKSSGVPSPEPLSIQSVIGEIKVVEEVEKQKRRAIKETVDYAAQAAQERVAIEQQYAQAVSGVAQGLASFVSAIAAQTVDDQSESSKAAFAITQGVAVVSAIINTALAVTNALATVQPYPAAIAAAASAAVMGGLQVGTIAAQTIGAVGDAGLTNDQLRTLGLNQHTTAIVRNDEMILDPVGTRYISEMLGVVKQNMVFSAGANRSAPVNVVLTMDKRVVGRAVADGFNRDSERGLNYQRRARA